MTHMLDLDLYMTLNDEDQMTMILKNLYKQFPFNKNIWPWHIIRVKVIQGHTKVYMHFPLTQFMTLTLICHQGHPRSHDHDIEMVISSFPSKNIYDLDLHISSRSRSSKVTQDNINKAARNHISGLVALTTMRQDHFQWFVYPFWSSFKRVKVTLTFKMYNQKWISIKV